MGAPPLLLYLQLLAVAAATAAAAGDGCTAGCDLALASYYIPQDANATYTTQLFGISDYRKLAQYNPKYPNFNLDFIPSGGRLNIPFRCNCLALPDAPASTYLAGAGTVDASVNCSCGDMRVSPDYGLFLTYLPRDGETLTSVAADNGFSSRSQMNLLSKYNPGMDGVTGSGIVYIPVKDPNGSYRPLKSSVPGNGASVGAITGGVVAGVAALVLGVLFTIILYKRRKAKEAAMLPSSKDSTQLASTISMDKLTPSTTQADGTSPIAGITIDKSVEFSYKELFSATEGFSMTNKIGQGGFGVVYYAELRGEKAAIKKMDMQATKEFLAELKVLTHVHHLNMVRLIGYCTERFLFLVYELVENGNLSQHLRTGTGYEPLSWAARIQIALDSARVLEYIHEHTVPVYIHRDIKSTNILIDKNSRAKVADFGLTKLIEVGGTSVHTRFAGTFGYMPPEYARYGGVSPKVDVYAFGVVLYELISAKEAIVSSTESGSDPKGLAYLFEEALNTPDPKESLQKLIDPSLRGDYPIDSILKMAHLAKECTQQDPKLRPTMRPIVVALMTLLSSSSEFWDMDNFCENPGLVSLMSARKYTRQRSTIGVLALRLRSGLSCGLSLDLLVVGNILGFETR